jgi:two-component system, LytTR family, sensor kinase
MNSVRIWFQPAVALFLVSALIAWLIQVLLIHRYGMSWSYSMTDALITTSVLALAAFIIYKTYRFYSPGSTHFIFRLAYIIGLSILSVWVSASLLQAVFTGQPLALEFVAHSLPVRAVAILEMIMMIGAIIWVRHLFMEREENKQRKIEAESLLREAELTRLRQQLQPHFLFNSLNSISALAGSEPERARTMIQNLSEFLRGTLHQDEQKLVTLTDELKHLQLYLEIEKVRFGHRLRAEIEVESGAESGTLPSLILQPVAENAVKHGIYNTLGDITIRITAKKIKGELVVEIINPIDSTERRLSNGTGFGLSSIRRRLNLIYARADLLQTRSTDHDYTTTLHIPQE